MDDLDKLAGDFAAGRYGAGGAELGNAQPVGTHGHSADVPVGTQGHGAGVRRFRYRGHDVEILTRYTVTIDGEVWDQHVEVLEDGSVTYHGLPQYAVPSAVDLIRRLIDR